MQTSCPVPGCGGRLDVRHLAIRLDERVSGVVVLEGWVAVCAASPGTAVGESWCGFAVALTPRRLG